jgi:DNA-binding FadR family transcriptional regulator
MPRRSLIPAYDQLAAELRERILDGTLQDGDRLPSESEMATEYAVSRNTAREAFRVLASEGLVIIKRGVTGGVFVAVPTPKWLAGTLRAPLRLLVEHNRVTLRSLAETRELIEVQGAEWAAGERTDVDLAAMGDALFSPGTIDFGQLHESSCRFHLALLAAAHNPLLEIVGEPILRVLTEHAIGCELPPRLAAEIDRDHREILRHLQHRDHAKAREATGTHLRELRPFYDQ